jgi:hypothetical protein
MSTAALTLPSKRSSAAPDEGSPSQPLTATAPLGYAGGDANLYRYCGNGPTDGTDPTGRAEPPTTGTLNPTEFAGAPGLTLPGLAAGTAAPAGAGSLAGLLPSSGVLGNPLAVPAPRWPATPDGEREQIIEVANGWNQTSPGAKYPSYECAEQAQALQSHLSVCKANGWKCWSIMPIGRSWGWRFLETRYISRYWTGSANALKVSPKGGNPLKPFILYPYKATSGPAPVQVYTPEEFNALYPNPIYDAS